MTDIGAPPIPRSIEETGLGESFLLDLALKHLYFGGTLQGVELAQRLGLDVSVVNPLLEELKSQQLIAATGGSGAFGGIWFRWIVTRAGGSKVEEILRRDNYRGPAPVPFGQYRAQLERQRMALQDLTPAKVEYAFSRLVLDPNVLARIGPAIRSGRPIFLYGPSGNGKTSMASCITEAIRGTAFVPYALLVDSEIVVVFDEVHHRRLGAEEGEHDRRWVHCERPTVVVGGELTLEALDLTSVPQATFFKAPSQVKANSGLLFIDDFGRQRCDPRDLLNRWIVPLESKADYLTFPSGQKVEVPFDSLVVFSTNLATKDLADDAFLRRIRYKIAIDWPSPEMYREIFRRQCAEHGITFDEATLEHLLEKHYRSVDRPLRACEPRDLLEQMADIQAFSSDMPELDTAAIDRLAELYFVDL
jgi:hypothetical protein